MLSGLWHQLCFNYVVFLIYSMFHTMALFTLFKKERFKISHINFFHLMDSIFQPLKAEFFLSKAEIFIPLEKFS